MSRGKLVTLFQRYVSLGNRDHDLENEIRRELHRINLDIPGVNPPDLNFAKRLLSLFSNSLKSTETKVNLVYIEKCADRYYIDKNSDDLVLCLFPDESHTYAYCFSFVNLSEHHRDIRIEFLKNIKDEDDIHYIIGDYSNCEENDYAYFDGYISHKMLLNEDSFNIFITNLKQSSLPDLERSMVDATIFTKNLEESLLVYGELIETRID
jgi:hypothetical protein